MHLDGAPHVLLGRADAGRQPQRPMVPARARSPSPAGRGSARPTRWCRRCRSRRRCPPDPGPPPGPRPPRRRPGKLALFGSRSVGWPVSVTPGRAVSLAISWSRSAPAARLSASRATRSSCASSQRPRESHDRRPRSPCRLVAGAPANRRTAAGSRAVPWRTNSAPTPFGPYELVRAQAQQVDLQRVDVQRQERPPPAPRRRGRGPCAARQMAPISRDRLDGSDLVVGVHDADHGRVDRGWPPPPRPGPPGRIGPPAGRSPRSRAAPGTAHECRTALCSTLLVTTRRPSALAAQAGALDGQVVVFSVAAGGEHDLARLGAEDARHRLACLVQARRARRPAPWRLEGLPKCSVRYGCMASSTSWPQRRGGGVVEVDAHGRRLCRSRPGYPSPRG